VGGSCQACEWFWMILRNRVSKNQPVESTWSLHGPRGTKTLARVLQRGLVESDGCNTLGVKHALSLIKHS